MEKKKYVYDVECYINYFEIKMMCLATRKIAYSRLFNDELSGGFDTRLELTKFLNDKTRQFISFNGNGYDIHIINAFLQGSSNAKMKAITEDIIVNKVPWWNIGRKHNLRKSLVNKIDHIDICQPAPSVQTSLKLYAGRLGAPKMQDLPVDPSETLNQSQVDAISLYCDNDLDVTARLHSAIEADIELREQLSDKYGIDLRSKSSPQMAEAIFKVYLEGHGIDVQKRQTKVLPFKYRIPEWVSFTSPEFKDILERVRNCTFEVSDKGVLKLPTSLSKAIDFDGAKYKFGVGGIHSQEKCQAVVCGDGERFAEWDVASLYPSIIIEQESFPLHLGRDFLKVYKQFFDQRMASKKRVGELKRELKDKSDDALERELHEHNLIVATNKLSLNGSYGKFGSVYSYLYSPELLAQTTITGQLSLLMLVERFTVAGAKVYSANTDGVNIKWGNNIDDEIRNIVFEWEILTGYTLEETPYSATYSRDVNNYIAITTGGAAKRKGAFGKGSLMKNPQNQICSDAVVEHITKGVDISEYINAESDPLKFCTIRTVTGGAVYKGEEIGKVVRFYHSTKGTVITYKKNGNKVPTSDGCRPMMNIEDFDNDIDYPWYINEAKSLLEDLGLDDA